MFAQSFRCLFLGDNPSWLKITAALAQSPFVSLTVQRASSSAAAFSAVSARSYDALALDLHASNFQALDSIQKFRSELPDFPILALFDPSAQNLADLPTKAVQAGASRCVSLPDLTSETLHTPFTRPSAPSFPTEKLPWFQRTWISASISAKTPPIRPRAPKSFPTPSIICFV
jgi:CheY-like chemotaxis protein